MDKVKIRAIKRYLSTNGVKYYDVQAELIDHFATAVEKAERENPNIPFKHALIKAHRAFGGREGFRKYINAAQKDVRKKTDKLLLRLFLKLFGWPDIILTAVIAIFWHFVFQNWKADVELLYLGLMIIGGFSVIVFNNYKLRKTRLFMPRQANNYLFSIFYLFIYLPYYFVISTQDETLGHILLVAFISLMTLTFISFTRIPKLAIAETLKKYPEIA